MSARVKRNLPLLHWLSRAKPKTVKSVLRGVDRDVLDTICEVCLNVLKGNVPMTPQQKRRLSKHKQTLRRLASASRRSDKVKRALVQKGGFLPLLLGTTVSTLAPLLKTLLVG